MTLPASGAISARAINIEFGRDPALSVPIGDSSVRAYCGVTSGPVSYSNFFGKSGFSATGNNGYTSGTSSTTSSVTYSCGVSVTVRGGSGNFSYAWVMTTTPSGCTLVPSTSAYATVNKTVMKNGSFYQTAVLQCTVTDTSTGVQIVVTGMQAQFAIDSTM